MGACFHISGVQCPNCAIYYPQDKSTVTYYSYTNTTGNDSNFTPLLITNIETAPWVEEIKKLKERIADLEKDEKMFLSEHDENVRLHFENVELKEQNARLRDALQRIGKASMPHEEPVSRAIARAALERE